MGFWAAAAKFAGAAVAPTVQEAVGRKLGPKLGIPSPGEEQAQFMNEAYPGTNPWERLGSPSSGAMAAAQEQRRSSYTAANAQRYSAETSAGATREAAATSAGAQEYSARISFLTKALEQGPQAFNAARSYLDGRGRKAGSGLGMIGTWPTQVTLEAQRMPAQIRLLQAQTGLARTQAESIAAKLKPEIDHLYSQVLKNNTDAEYKAFQNLTSTVYTAAKETANLTEADIRRMFPTISFGAATAAVALFKVARLVLGHRARKAGTRTHGWRRRTSSDGTSSTEEFDQWKGPN